MTGYHIRLGYNGAIYNGYANSDAMWDELKRKTTEICGSPERIAAEARRLGSPETSNDGCWSLEAMCDAYKTGDAYNPITIIEQDVLRERQIMQLASTGEPIKYHVRRAFVRLLMEEMHKCQIEISVSVV